MKKRIFSLIIALVLTLACFPTTAFAVDYSLPSLWQEYEDYVMMGTFGNWNNPQQLYHYKGNSPSNAMKLDSQIGNNNTNNLSRQNYLAEIEKINADASLSESEKAAKIEEANRNVVLVERPAVMNTLDQIRTYNAGVPEREKKMVRGHVLVWHGGQQPMYFFMNGFVYNKDNPDWASPETMLARLDAYIQQMMEKYSVYNDVIYSWDVVNEGIDDYSGQVRNMDDPLKQNGQWGKVFRRTDLDNNPDQRLYEESVFIREAFASARRWSEHYDADWTLYYNDFQDSNKPYEPKMSQTVKMLKPIYEAGNVDGYGMQGRLSSVFPSVELLRQQFELGLTVADELAFTEADIRSDFKLNPDYDPTQPTLPNGDGSEINTYDADNATAIRRDGWGKMNVDGWNRTKAAEIAMREDIQREQADYAADLMDLIIEFKDEFTFLQWDGTNDSSTFNSSKGAHMWGGTTGNPEKMSYFSIIGAPNRDKMKQAIAKGPLDSGEAYYTPESWATYKSAKGAAETLVDVRIYDMAGVAAVKEATSKLLAAIDELDGFQIKVPGVENVECKAGTEFTLPVNITKFPQDDQYKSIEGVISIPQGVDVVSIKTPALPEGVKFDFNLSDGKLRFAFLATDKDALSFEAGKLLDITLALTEDKETGSSFKIAFDAFTVKSAASSFAFDLADASSTITVTEEKTALAKDLFVSDDTDVIPAGKKAVSVVFTGIDKSSDIRFDDVQFYYSPDRSTVHNQVVYVALVDEAITLDELNEIGNYDTENSGVQTLIFGDTNDLGDINAQDALNTLAAWLRKGTAPSEKQMLAMNVNADGCINTSDAIAIVDWYISAGETIFTIVSK